MLYLWTMKRNDGAYEMTTNTCYDYVKRDSSTTNATALAKTAKSQRSCSKLTTVLVVGVCVNMLLTVCGLALAIFAIANQRNAPSLRLEDQMIPNMNGGLQLITLSKLADDLNSTQLQVKQLMENVGAMFTAQSDINELVSRINMTGASQGPPGRTTMVKSYSLKCGEMEQWAEKSQVSHWASLLVSYRVCMS